MAPRAVPGLVFWIECESGYAVGWMTHKSPLDGPLVWLSKEFFDRPPTLEDARTVSWRWFVFFPLSTCLHHGEVTAIGKIPVPPEMEPFPRHRSGNHGWGWWFVDPFATVTKPKNEWEVCSDPDIPMAIQTGNVGLRELLDSGWMPRDDW